jgi:hypothetical protein
MIVVFLLYADYSKAVSKSSLKTIWHKMAEVLANNFKRRK